LAANKTIHLATAGGASLTIEGGKITISCPGQLTVHAGNKVFTGGSHMSRAFNSWPKTSFDERFQVLDDNDKPVAHYDYELTRADGARIRGTTDEQGTIPIQRGMGVEDLSITLLGPATASDGETDS